MVIDKMMEKVKTTYLELRDEDQFHPKKGFRERLEVKEEEKIVNVPENSELVKLTAEFFAGYIKRYPPQ